MSSANGSHSTHIGRVGPRLHRRHQGIRPTAAPKPAVRMKRIKSSGRQADRHWDPVTGRKKNA